MSLVEKRKSIALPQKLDTIGALFKERKVKYNYEFKLEYVELVVNPLCVIVYDNKFSSVRVIFGRKLYRERENLESKTILD